MKISISALPFHCAAGIREYVERRLLPLAHDYIRALPSVTPARAGMNATMPPLDGSIAVCETCYCVEEPDGRWTARHVSWVPPAHGTRWDICDDCCDRYVKCLLAPLRLDADGAPVLPRFRHRGYV